MEKVRQREIRDYLHLYLGQDCRCYSTWDTDGWKETVTPDLLIEVSDEDSRIGGLRLILRPLSDMTEEEDQIEFPKHNRGEFIDMHWYPEGYVWLLSKGFDLFGLIEEGLAVDKTNGR